jgi:hypothetical protein
VDAVITDPPYGVNFEGKANKIKPVRTGGYEGEDSDIGPRAAPIFLAMCDRAVIFPGLRLMWDYPRPYEIGCVARKSSFSLDGVKSFHEWKL